MKTIRYALLLGYFLASLFPSPAIAQETPDTNRIFLIETLEGNSFTGEVLQDDGIRIVLLTTAYGTITIQRENIRSIRLLESAEIRGREAWITHPQSTRYFYSPTGYGLRKGEGYYQNVWVFFNQFAVGLTDHISIGAGIVPLFLFAGAPTPVWITPKVSIPLVRDKLALGAGALMGTVIGEDGGFFGIPYGMLTLGDRSTNISFGMGYGFSGGDFANSPTFEINGMLRVSPKTYLLSENLIIADDSETVVVLSVGGRTVWTGVSLDYGLVIPSGTGESFLAIPWLGLVVPFGNKKPLGPLE